MALAVAGQAFGAKAVEAPRIKVLIGRSLKDVVIHGTDLRQQVPSKKLVRQFAGHQVVNFNCRVNGSVALPEKPLLVASVGSPTGLVGWEKERYRGELHLVAGPEAEAKGCDLVNHISMEDYLSSLLAKEMRADWPIEALKAQAVVARSYALAKLNPQGSTLPWHLESSEKNQVSGSFYDTTTATDRASLETKGEVLADRLGKPVEGFFHSKCGGHTLRPDQVWSGNVEGYRGVTCPYCHRHGKVAWREKVSKEKFAELLSRAITRYRDRPVRVAARELTLVGDAPHRSELRVYSGNELHVVKKSWLRNLAGRELFPSHRFTLADQGPYLALSGEGLGHGVGLCQLGAFELAKRGYDYRAILQHYFPEFKITRVWQ